MTERTNGYDYKLISNIDYHLNLRMIYNYFRPKKKLFIGIYKSTYIVYEGNREFWTIFFIL